MNRTRNTMPAFRKAAGPLTAAAMLMIAASAAHAQCLPDKLLADDAASGDSFGRALAADTISGGPLLVVGVPFDDNAQGGGAGSVYTFMRGAGGVGWAQTGHFWPNDLASGFGFGKAVSLRDPYLIVGAPDVDASAGTNCGAVYIYERSGGTWANKGRMIPSWAIDNAAVGSSVDITAGGGGWAIVAAPNMDYDGNAAQSGLQNPASGAVGLYQRSAGGTWSLAQTVNDFDASGSGASQHLGRSVAISDVSAVIGAPDGKATGQPNQSGYIKVLQRTGSNWNIVGPSRMAAADAQSGDRFGSAVDTIGTYMAVSAPMHDSTAAQTPHAGATTDAGCVYMYKWNSATSAWDLDGQLFATDATPGMQLGAKVKFNGFDVMASSTVTQKVYTFRRLAAFNWVQDSVVKRPTPGTTAFAYDFAGVDSEMFISDADDSSNGLTHNGATFAYRIIPSFQSSDTCAGARPIYGTGLWFSCTNAATLDGTTNCGIGGTGFGPDIWYSWTPPCSGMVGIDLAGSDFDTVLSVHSACPQSGNSHTIACNDDDGGFLGAVSRLEFNCVAGINYIIRIAGFAGASGNVELNIAYANPVINDSCSSPAPLADNGNYPFSNCSASTDGPDNGSCGSLMGNDLWYSFYSPVPGTLRVDTCGSSVDTVLAIYGGGGCPSQFLPELACNDDSPVGGPCSGTSASAISQHVIAAFGYTIRLGGYLGAVGDGFLHVNFVADCPCDWNRNNQVSVQDIFDFLADFFAGHGDFNQVGGTSVQDIFDFLACYFGGCH